jgi:hypothetical protein
VKNSVFLLFYSDSSYAYLSKVTSAKQRSLQRLAALQNPVLVQRLSKELFARKKKGRGRHPAPETTQKGSEQNFVMALRAQNRKSS